MSRYFTRSKARQIPEEEIAPPSTEQGDGSSSSSSSEGATVVPDVVSKKKTRSRKSASVPEEEHETTIGLEVPMDQILSLLAMAISASASRALPRQHASRTRRTAPPKRVTRSSAKRVVPQPLLAVIQEEESVDESWDSKKLGESSSSSDDSNEGDDAASEDDDEDDTTPTPQEFKKYLEKRLTREVPDATQRDHLAVALNRLFEELAKYKTLGLANILESDIGLEDKYRVLLFYQSWIESHDADDLEDKMELNDLLRQYIGDTTSAHYLAVRRGQIHHPKTAVEKILELETTDEIKARLLKFLDQKATSDSVSDGRKIWQDKMNWYTSLPYQHLRLTPIPKDKLGAYCAGIYERLDQELYGLVSVKQQIVMNVYTKMLYPDHQVILALSGSPGTGKTACALAMAQALDLPMEQISMAGMNDAAVFKGHDGVYSGSGPGILLQKLKQAGCADPVLLLDELDKLPMQDTKARQVQYALLHLFDPLQHTKYQDLYLTEIPHDMSRLWIVATMNDHTQLDPALRDRMTIIHVPDYTPAELDVIMRNYTFPKLLKRYGLSESDCQLTEGACQRLRQVRMTRDESGNSGRFFARFLDSLLKQCVLLNALLSVEASDHGKEAQATTSRMGIHLDDFRGFPYSITAKTIDQLSVDVKRDGSHYGSEMMYV